MMKFFSENHSGDVNIDSGRTGILHPFWPGIDIHIASESLFTSLRNDYSHAPESAVLALLFVPLRKSSLQVRDEAVARNAVADVIRRLRPPETIGTRQVDAATDRVSVRLVVTSRI
jgi:hypothetical protein